MNKNLFILLTPLILLGCGEEPANTGTSIQTINKPILTRTFSPPISPTVLSISGSVTQFNSGEKLLLDRETLFSFEQKDIKTTTLWTDGESTFSGPLLKDVLESAGNFGKVISAIAINEYSIQIPIADIQKYPVILALKQDGKILSVREKGPIWVIYPWSSYDELKQDKYYSRSIWQLKKITVHD